MSEKKIPYKIYLEESEMPKTWYNVRADMKNKPAPLLNPETFKPMTEEELSVVFCEELVKQELDNENRYIEIPEKIRDFYKMYRPAPLIRAYCLEEKLQTPAMRFLFMICVLLYNHIFIWKSFSHQCNCFISLSNHTCSFRLLWFCNFFI